VCDKRVTLGSIDMGVTLLLHLHLHDRRTYGKTEHGMCLRVLDKCVVAMSETHTIKLLQ
jgi:hypothetical protein